jgi:hypothetical protein
VSRFHHIPLAAWLAAAGFGTSLAGCGGATPPAPSTVAQPPAEVRVGDVTVRATTLSTLQLNDAMARTYDVERDAGSVLLVVGMRRGPDSSEVSLPGTVTASASDLLGKRQRVVLRPVDSGGYIDHVGVFDVSMPDTLRFRVDARPQGAPAATLEFNRDFFPAAENL